MKVYSSWHQAETGRIFSVKVTTDTGRILATARVEAALAPGFSLEERIGAEAVREIEASVLHAAQETARAVATPPRKEGLIA